MCLQPTSYRLADNRQDLGVLVASDFMAEKADCSPAEHMQCFWCVMLLFTHITQAGGLQMVWQIMSRTAADKSHVHPCCVIWSRSAKEACAVLFGTSRLGWFG